MSTFDGERCIHEDEWTLTVMRESGWVMHECNDCGASWTEPLASTISNAIDEWERKQ